ncbi:MAG: hypothetical protein V8R81_01765 [Clostridia bacterium]
MEYLDINKNIKLEQLEKFGFEKRYSEFTGELSYYTHPEEDIEIHIYENKATELIIHEKEIKHSLMILLIKLHKAGIVKIEKEKEERMSTLDEMVLRRG